MSFSTRPSMVMFHPGNVGELRLIRFVDTGVTNEDTCLVVENCSNHEARVRILYIVHMVHCTYYVHCTPYRHIVLIVIKL